MEGINTQIDKLKGFVNKIKVLGFRRNKLIVLVFVIFSTIVAIVTLSSELKKGQIPTITPTPQLSPTPTELDQPSVNSSIKEIDNTNNLYQNRLYGFSFEYPKSIGLVQENGAGSPSASTIYITIDNLTGPRAKNANESLRDREILSSGDFGLENSRAKYYQKGVVGTGGLNVKLFTQLQEEDCLGVDLLRSAVFYRFDRRIKLTLKGPRARFIKDFPDFFTKGGDACDKQTVWGTIGIEAFIAALTSRTAPEYILKWQDDFAYVISTLKIGNPTDPTLFDGSVKGRWQGDNMVVTLAANNKLGKVTEMKLWYGENEEGVWEPYDVFKMVPSKEKIRARYKDQFGNISPIYMADVEFK